MTKCDHPLLCPSLKFGKIVFQTFKMGESLSYLDTGDKSCQIKVNKVTGLLAPI